MVLAMGAGSQSYGHGSKLVRREPRRYVSRAYVIVIVAHEELAGMVIGVNAAIISIITQWLSDIKFGYCSDGWWLNEQFCCWEIEGEDVDGCDSWHTWSNVMMGRWTVFVFFAVSVCSFESNIQVLRRRVDVILIRRGTSSKINGKVCSGFRYL